MKRLFGASVVFGILATIVAYDAAPSAQQVKAPASLSDSDLNAAIKQYCSGCHSDAGKSGNLSLAGFDVTEL